MNLCMGGTLSLKAKLSIGVCLIVAVITSAIAYSSLRYFQQQLKANLAAQQFVLVSAIAGHIDESIMAAQDELLEIAKSFPLDLLQDADRAQSFLKERAVTETRFDNGILILSPKGELIAEIPFSPGRKGKNLSFRDFFQKTLASGGPVIPAPFFSSKIPSNPMVALSAPLFNAKGQVVGMLSAGIDLTKDNFLGKIRNTTIGKSGYLYLFNADRTVIMHPDQSCILNKDVP